MPWVLACASLIFFFFFFLREKVTGARNSVLGKHLWAAH